MSTPDVVREEGFTEQENAPVEMHTASVVRPEMAGVSEASWKRSVVAFLITLVASLSLIAALNYVVNPLGNFSTHYLPPMVWNGRGEKITALAHEEPKPKVLIFGSSHAWAVSPATVTRLTGLPAFNAGVSVGMTEDYYALLRYAVEQVHVQPELVLIALDVESLNNGKPVDPRTQKTAELRSYLPKTGFSERVARLKPLLAMQTTKLSLRSLRFAMRGRNGTPPDDLYTVGAHGDTHLTTVEKSLATGKTTRAQEIQATMAIYGPRWENFTALSPMRFAYLQRTLDYCRQRHIRVVVFLTPLHPALQNLLTAYGYPARRKELTERAAKMVEDAGGTFLNYADVDSFGGAPEGFLDGAHLDEPTGDRMTKKLLEDAHVIQ